MRRRGPEFEVIILSTFQRILENSINCFNRLYQALNINILKMSGAAKRLLPLLDRVLVRKADAITTTKGGIVIPDKAAAKVLKATVVAVGPGARNKNGDHIPLSVKVGDNVLLPEYGGTKVEVEENQEFHLFRESDILAKLE